MFPSKVIFSQQITLASSMLNNMVVEGFDEIFSPKQTLEELLAEILVYLQNKVKENPGSIVETGTIYGLRPQRIEINISKEDDLHLSSIIQAKGENLHFDLNIEYADVLLVGFMKNQFLITHVDADIWNEFTDIIYLPAESGFSIRKIKFIE
jgi:hypothetical protein